MKYVINHSMEFLEIDDENTAVYDNESGDTHYISGTGTVILKLLEESIEYENLISALCGMYEADESVISADVSAFLSELVEKKVVVCN